MDYAIAVNNLTKAYSQKEVISSLNMHVKRGSIYGFLGPNGSGKSTTMKMIMNLVKPDIGSISVLGSNLEKNNYDIFKRISAIIELPAFYKGLSANEALKLHCSYMGYYKYDDIPNVLKKVGLENTNSKPVNQFSLGMKQRLAIARAILTHPELLILDEPVNGLDPEGIIQIRNLLKQLNEEENTTILISSHILSEIELIADTIGIIDKGRIIKEISMKEIQAMNGDYVELEVDDVKKAGCLLDSQLNIKNYRIISDTRLRIYDDAVNKNEIAGILINNNISIDSISLKHISLEEYFHQLTGGKYND